MSPNPKSRVMNFGFISIFIILTIFCGFDFGIADEPAVIWAIASSSKGFSKLSADGKSQLIGVDGFEMLIDIDIDASRDCVWLLDKDAGKVYKFSGQGKELAQRSGLSNPFHGVVDPQDGSYFVVDQGNRRVVKVSADGQRQLFRIKDFIQPHDIIYSAYDNSFWVSDPLGKKIVKLSAQGERLAELGGFDHPHHLAIDANNGSLWVADSNIGMVAKVASDGSKILCNVGGFGYPFEMLVDPRDSSLWVTDEKNGEVVRVSSEGKILARLTGFKGPRRISSINIGDGTFWISETAQRVIKLSQAGERLSVLDGYKYVRLSRYRHND